MAILIFGFGSWKFTVPLLIFFTSANAVGKTGKNLKKQFELMFEKSSMRDARQVFANGSIAVTWVVIYYFYEVDLVYFLYLSSIAAANSDTWATELGVFSKSKPRLITSFKEVEKGTSGGISLIGSMAAFCGSLLISLTVFIFVKNEVLNFNILLSITVAGFLASFVDSFLGASFQGQYRDPQTKQITEKAFFDLNKKNKLISGYRWLNNDRVNFLSILTAPLFYYLLSLTF